MGHIDSLWQLNPDAANKLEVYFEKAIGRIISNPFQFQYADELDVPNILPNTYRKCQVYKHYKILFLVKDNELLIDVVIDSRRRANVQPLITRRLRP